jgi:ABC-type dipeptide/oligopeptide/nickel transport system permease subunit
MSELTVTAARRQGFALSRTQRSKRLALQILRNKKLFAGGVLVLALIAIALLAPWIAPYPPDKMSVTPLYQKPSGAHWLGGDEFGRDLLSRIMHGARISLGVSAIVTGSALIAGGLLGLAAGLLGGRIDSVVSGLADLLFGVPTVLLALFAAAIFGTGLKTVVIALSIVYIPQFVRVVRAASMDASNREYVQAARAIGASSTRVAFRHVLPNCMAPLIVQVALVSSLVILDEAGLSFIGVGTQPPTPSWGIILRQGLDYLTRTAHPAVIAGASIFFAVFTFNLLADGLRDHLDPRLRGR